EGDHHLRERAGHEPAVARPETTPRPQHGSVLATESLPQSLRRGAVEVATELLDLFLENARACGARELVVAVHHCATATRKIDTTTTARTDAQTNTANRRLCHFDVSRSASCLRSSRALMIPSDSLACSSRSSACSRSS